MVAPIQELLEKIVTSEKNQWKWYLLKNWNTIVGDLSQRMRLERIQDENTLLIGVYNSAWIQELYFLSHIIIRTINQHLDTPRIKNLRFKYSPAIVSYKKIIPKHSPPPIAVTLSTREKAALAHMSDPDLRKAVEDFLVRCYRERAWPT
jgi:hypothetical protein